MTEGQQCSKLRFNFVRSSGARDFSCALLYYVAMIIGWENVRTSSAHVRKTYAQPRKCARRAPSAPLISNTGQIV